MFLSKYGVARHIYIPIIKRAVVDFAVGADWTPAAGDVKISKDGGAAANVTNLPSAIAMGNGAIWDFSLTATEMQAAQIVVTVADSATKAVEDQSFIIETHGHASAQLQIDLADSVRAGLTALPNAAADAAGGLPISDVGGLDLDAKVGALTFTVANKVDANATHAAGTAWNSGAIGAATLATDTITAAKIAADAIGASELAADAVTEIQSGLATAAALSTVAGYVDTEVAAILAAVDTEVAAIKAKTDNLPAAPAATSDIPTAAAVADAVWEETLGDHSATSGSTAEALAAAGGAGDPWITPLPGSYSAGQAGKIVGDILVDTGTDIPATLATIAAYIDTEVAAIKAKTDNLPAAPAATGDIPTANANADALLDRSAGVETGLTLRQALRLTLAALAGKVSGAGSGTEVFRNAIADSKDRITATVDVDGNRTAITTDLT